MSSCPSKSLSSDLVSWLQEAHIAKLQGALDAGGDASLQNAMNLAIESLRSIPPYGHREVTDCPSAKAADLTDGPPL